MLLHFMIEIIGTSDKIGLPLKPTLRGILVALSVPTPYNTSYGINNDKGSVTKR